MRVALGLAYDGTAYHGWQCQTALPTVQSTVEKALSYVAAAPISVVCAGRTDQGVHALGQVIHFDTSSQRSERAWVVGTNDKLPADIRVLWASPIASQFHARFSATARCYRYIIYQNKIRLPWLLQNALWHCTPLDIVQMQVATQYLMGKHDFNALRASRCQSKTPYRSIHHLAITSNEHWIFIDITANAFLHHMVRNIVGVLIEIGEGKRTADSIPRLLASRDRCQAAATAQAHGLYLQQAIYPKIWSLPQPALHALFTTNFL